MSTSTSVALQSPYRAPRRAIVGPKPLSTEQARDLLYLAAVLRRWDHVLEACSGDREQALRVWRAVGDAELVHAGLEPTSPTVPPRSRVTK